MSGGSISCVRVHVVALGGLQWTDRTPYYDTSERRARRCDCKLLYTVCVCIYAHCICINIIVRVYMYVQMDILLLDVRIFTVKLLCVLCGSAQDGNGHTALHVACQNGHYKVSHKPPWAGKIMGHSHTHSSPPSSPSLFSVLFSYWITELTSTRPASMEEILSTSHASQSTYTTCTMCMLLTMPACCPAGMVK